MSVWWQSAQDASGAVARHAASQRSPLLRWLIGLGGLGLFAVAIADSSVIPLPLPGSTDLLLLLLTAHRNTSPLMAVGLALCAVAGSSIGGYLTWSAGAKGGEAALGRYVPKRFQASTERAVQRHGVWAVAVATLLPPPVPLTPFLLVAGALGMKRLHFLLSYGSARALRYGLLAWLGVTYGRHVVRLWQKELAGWSAPILWTYAALVVMGVAYGFWKRKRSQPKAVAEEISAEDAA